MARKASQRRRGHIPKSVRPVDISATPGAPPLDEITAESLEDQVKHAACRAGFYMEMLRDPRLGGLFDRWWLETGLAAALVRLRGLPEPEQIAELESGALEREFSTRAQRLGDDALAFVRDTLHLEWPWVWFDLLTAFVCESVTQAFRIEVGREFAVAVHDDLPAPPFSTEPGETLTQALDRMIAEAVARAPQGAPSPRQAARRMPKNEAAELEEAGRWFYRIRVRGESLAAVAREYTAARRSSGLTIADDNRTTVRARIRGAETVLAMTAWVILPLEK